jgi:GNAT superfamily N-acetyltransferase
MRFMVGASPAMAILDGVLQSDGVYDQAPELVQALVRLTHAAGGLWVADEVQGGHGRTGETMWSFERFGIEPDIVTLGKPMGNGHPVAALITRRDIAERFAADTVFFSTFGGNQVSVAAAHAVLDVLADERVLPRVWWRRACPAIGSSEIAMTTSASATCGHGAGEARSRSSPIRETEGTGAGDGGDQNGLRDQGVLVGDDRHQRQHAEGPPHPRLHRPRGPTVRHRPPRHPRGPPVVTVDLREVASGDYEYLIGRVDDWWGGRSMAPMLPRLFFDHFPATTRIACDADDGATLGFVCGFVSQADPRVAYIHFVGVDPAARGRDVGRTLYRWFAAQARARGCTSIACVTSPVNTGSRAFPRRGSREDVGTTTGTARTDSTSTSRILAPR